MEAHHEQTPVAYRAFGPDLPSIDLAIAQTEKLKNREQFGDAVEWPVET